ncbi:SulP family inorganic anion transporter [Desulfotalea psychrophila]|uniref:Probable sulfate permease (SulP) n=1 Tax=Desulfotalea psychrophila (strain LSv54 / DSM 12343) TaxID=177439 RepID=Q6ARY3_DESPS|nr:SulP family inorganic anion transporter [Desulfotalea psychrophila]CAG34892.1 probable sulfate permease (SulP) [Desulfotalea psychrophila LSv54]
MKNNFSPKLFSILKLGYSKEQFINDLFSGLVVAVVALPLAIAFAVASGVSPEKGLVTAVVAGLIIAILGGSRVQIGGPTGAFIVIVFGILQQYGMDGLIISTIMAGCFLVLFGVFGLGSLLSYFPYPLIVGFTSGIAIVIFTTQVKDALGLTIFAMPGDMVGKWHTYFANISSTNISAVSICIITILIATCSGRFIKKIPGSFLAIIFITVAVQVFKLPVTTIETFYGEIPSSISFCLPHVNLADLPHYLRPAITIALLGAIESLLSAVVADGMISGNHRSNTELIAQGIANIVTPFFGGIPATGAIARTATNVKNGGRTPVAGVIHAIGLFLIMIFFGQYAKLIPMSCLAGILIVVSYNMSEWRTFLSILKMGTFDRFILLTTFLLTVFVDLTVAIEVGIVLAALIFMKRMADAGNSSLETFDKDIIDDYSSLPQGVSIYEISGPFFFASAKKYASLITTTGMDSDVLIIRMRHVPFIDSTGLKNLRAALQTLNRLEIKVIISGPRDALVKVIKSNIPATPQLQYSLATNFNEAMKKATLLLNVNS